MCTGILLIDVLRHPQKMAIMNWVWPVTALYAEFMGDYIVAYVLGTVFQIFHDRADARALIRTRRLGRSQG